MIDIQNWTSAAEARELRRLAAGRRVLEVGCFRGHGTVTMALAGAEVWAVDWHRGDSGGDPALGEQDTLASWWRNVRRWGVEDRVIGLVGRSAQVLPALQTQRFDLAFIDADHDCASALQDGRLALPLLRSGGTLAFHDHCALWPGVVQAVAELRRVEELLGRLDPARFRLVDSLACLHVL